MAKSFKSNCFKKIYPFYFWACQCRLSGKLRVLFVIAATKQKRSACSEQTRVHIDCSACAKKFGSCLLSTEIPKGYLCRYCSASEGMFHHCEGIDNSSGCAHPPTENQLGCMVIGGCLEHQLLTKMGDVKPTKPRVFRGFSVPPSSPY